MGLFYLSGSEGQLLVFGLSTDTKPTNPQNGWSFRELDTNNIFFASNTAWNLLTIKNENYYRQVASNTATALFQSFYIGGGASNASALGTQAMSINTMTAVHFVVTKNMRVDSMAILATVTGAGCLIRLGIYTNSADTVLQPFQMVSTSGQLVCTPNVLTQFQVNQTLSANNLYWFIMDVGTGAATVRSVALASAYPIFGVNSGLGTSYNVALNSGKLFQTGWPSTFGPGWGFITLASIPVLAVRASV